MTTTVAIHHQTAYRYDRRVSLSPQVIRLRPAPHVRIPIERYSMRVEPAGHFCNVQQDPYGNFLARIVFPEPTDYFRITIDLQAELVAVNPFDFFLEPTAEEIPFAYDPSLAPSLAPYLITGEYGSRFEAYLASLSREPTHTVAYLVALNQKLSEDVRYVIRMEPGVQTPEETLTLGSGSCRDSAWLFVQLARRLGLAARFVSGYLVQLVADVPAIDGPSGPTADFTDLHAWAEVYLPGAGWVGLDPTSGLFAGEGHIPLAASANPDEAAPVSGSFAYEKDDDDDEVKSEFEFAMRVERVRESPRASRRYDRSTWDAVVELGRDVDRRLRAAGIALTMGGEPTFVASDDPDGDEWNTTAVGPTKHARGLTLAKRLLDAFAPNGLLHVGMGKWYPGEPLPRWAITVGFLRDGRPLWNDRGLVADEAMGTRHGLAEAFRVTSALVRTLGVETNDAIPAYEDALYHAWRERKLPVDDAVYDGDLASDTGRARLLEVLAQDLGKPVGYVLPLEATFDGFRSGPWVVRTPHLELIPGDSPMGLRLPLDSLPRKGRTEPVFDVHDPLTARAPLVLGQGPIEPTRMKAADAPARTAVCVEPRKGVVHVFLPPVPSLDAFVRLVECVEAAATAANVPVRLEGYLPPKDPRFVSLQVTPDPGVIEVNVQPAADFDELVHITTTVYAEAAACRLVPDKFLLDGRHVGSGGGHHLVLGGASPAESVFLRRPELLGGLLAYAQAHPSLDYVFSGLFIGPTSQHPRVDEARRETTREFARALELLPRGETDRPWLADRILRDVLVDATGNTHRTGISIDKLFSPDGSAGRQGLVEFRGFEMAPDAQMSLVTQLLLRSLVARLAVSPFRGPVVEFGDELHDRYLLPHHLTADLLDVVDDLRAHGIGFDPSWFERHLEFRFPTVGEVHAGDVAFEVRTALEPWHVLGEEGSQAGTVRYVDSSVERVQVKLEGAREGRHALFCNGRRVPLARTGRSDVFVAGVRFRAWQPGRCLHPTLPSDAPLVFELLDRHRDRVAAACTVHVGHPGGRNYETRPVNAREAEGRRRARFLPEGSTGLALDARDGRDVRSISCTLDLLRG